MMGYHNGVWREEKTLGSGGFGTVMLFKNTEMNEFRAVKKCRMFHEMNQRQKQRWTQECDIMMRLQHPNVIKAFEVPTQLQGFQEGDLPLLVMEYCEGGDLRKTLNKPENSCGLSEPQVRHIVHDVSMAVEYLHTNRIMHRDLKPENIVIHKGDDQIYYKLIDLGYAKNLDQSSVCTSFVGTMQYLAPELFQQGRYTCVVDFWSFGTLAFEVCTGFRPFLHSVPPIKWQNDVSRKKDDEIYAYDDSGRVAFSKNIPAPNYLCRTTVFYLEQWLRLMLQWDPKTRGGGLNQRTSRYKCFEMLESILAIRVIHFFVVPTNELLSFPLPTKNMLLRELMELVAREVSIPVQQQELLLANGSAPDINGLAENCVDEQANIGHDDLLLYVFNKAQTSLPGSVRKVRAMPQNVSAIVNEPRTITSYPASKVGYSHAVYFCKQVAKDYNRLFEAYRAALLCLIRHNTPFNETREELKTQMSSLKAKMEFFEQCQEYDVDRYLSQSQTGISSEKMYTLWLQMKTDVYKFKAIEQEIDSLVQDSQALSQKVMELHRSPYAKNKMNQNLKDIQDKAIKLLEDFKNVSVDKRKQGVSNMPMVDLVVKCLSERKTLTDDLYSHISKVLQCKYEVMTQIPVLENLHKKLTTSLEKLEGYQRQRQKDMWQLVHVGLSEIKQLKKKFQKYQQQVKSRGSGGSDPDAPGLSLSGGYPQTDAAGTLLLGRGPVSNGAGPVTSLLLDRCGELSLSAMQENSSTRTRLESLISSFEPKQTPINPFETPLNWNFLKGGQHFHTDPLPKQSEEDKKKYSAVQEC